MKKQILKILLLAVLLVMGGNAKALKIDIQYLNQSILFDVLTEDLDVYTMYNYSQESNIRITYFPVSSDGIVSYTRIETYSNDRNRFIASSFYSNSNNGSIEFGNAFNWSFAQPISEKIVKLKINALFGFCANIRISIDPYDRLDTLICSSSISYNPIQIDNQYNISTRIKKFDCSYSNFNDYSIIENSMDSLKQLICNNCSLSKLNLNKKGLNLISYLKCNDNKISSLNINNANSLTYVSCYNNQLPLSDLYVISEKISDVNSKLLGTQTLIAKTVNTKDVVDLSSQATFGGIATDFEVKKGSELAVKDVDYTLSETGLLSFLVMGSYTVTMTNAAITSHASYPAKVIQPYTVNEKVISFTWQAQTNISKNLDITVSNGGSYIMEWGNNSSSSYTGSASSQTRSKTYYTSGAYTVNIDRTNSTTQILGLDISGRNITSLDLSNIASLNSLNCSNNALLLSDLYAASKKVSNPDYFIFSNQTIDTVDVVLNQTIDLSAQAMFDGIPTEFIVKKNTELAIEGIDYTLNEGILSFLTAGNYTVEMSNSAIVGVQPAPLPAKGLSAAQSNTPMVVLQYVVDISTNTSAINQKPLNIYPNPTNGIVNIQGLGNDVEMIRVYNINGSLLQELVSSSIDLSAYSKGLYLIEINGKKYKVVKE